MLAAFAAGAAAIHASVIQAHFLEGWPFGVFFTVATTAQLAWALLIMSRPSRILLLVGAWGNVSIALVWIASRTIGLPAGSHPWEAEPVTALDATASAFEIGIFLLVLLKIRTPARRDLLGVSSALVAIALSATVIAVSEPHLHLSSRRIDPGRVQAAALAGTTDGEIITAPLYGGYVEAFVESIEAGPNAVHVGFFSRSGADRRVTDLQLRAESPTGAELDLATRPLAPSHFVASVKLTAGTWVFRVSAATEQGERLIAEFRQRIKAR